MTSLISLTLSAAREAANLYFEPLRTLFGERTGETNHGTHQREVLVDRHPSHRELLIDALRDEFTSDSALRNLGDAEIEKLVRGKDVIFTGAAHPLAPRIAHLIYGCRPARVCLVETTRKRKELFQAWGKYFRDNAAALPATIFGDLADDQWLQATFQGDRPKIIIDFSAHQYFRSPLLPISNAGAQRRYAHLAEQGQNAWSVFSASSRLLNVESVFLVCPKYSRPRVMDRLTTLQETVGSEARAVGTYMTDEDSILMLWEPKHGLKKRGLASR
jgi:hypothetical protein